MMCEPPCEYGYCETCGECQVSVHCTCPRCPGGITVHDCEKYGPCRDAGCREDPDDD